MSLKGACFLRQNWAIYYIQDRNWSWKQALLKLMSTHPKHGSSTSPTEKKADFSKRKKKDEACEANSLGQ